MRSTVHTLFVPDCLKKCELVLIFMSLLGSFLIIIVLNAP